MSALLGQLALNMLGAYHTATPNTDFSVNPDFYGFKDNKPVDKDGNPVNMYNGGTPYKQPTFWDKALNPSESSRAIDINNQYATMPGMMGAQAKAQEISARNTWIDRMSQDPNIGPEVQANPAAAWAKYGGHAHMDPVDWNTQSEAAANLAANNPSTKAAAIHNTLLAQGKTGANIANTADVYNLYGGPTSQGTAEALGAQHSMNVNAGDVYRDPDTEYNKDLSTGLGTTKLLGDINAQPARNAQAYNTANLGANISGQQLQDSPYTTGAMHDEAITGLYHAQNPDSLYPSYTQGHVNPDDSLTLGGVPMQNQMMGQMAGGIGQQYQTPDGKFHGVPDRQVVRPLPSQTGESSMFSSPAPHDIHSWSGTEKKQLEPIQSMPEYSYDEKGNLYHTDENGNPTPVKVAKDSPIDLAMRNQKYLKDKIEKGHKVPELPHGMPNMLYNTTANSIKGTLLNAPVYPGVSVRSAIHNPATKAIGSLAGSLWDKYISSGE